VTSLPAPRQPNRSELKHARRITKRGDHYLQDDRAQTAAEAYLKALAIAPDYAPAIRPLVQIYLKRGNASEARQWAQHLAAVEPDSANSHLLLGDAYALGNEDALATQAWERASTLGSDAASKRLSTRH
jgi:Tfp pilus assembly protein PilF